MKKFLSYVMSFILVLGAVTISFPLSISAHTTGTRIADAPTLDGWKNFFGEDVIHTGFSGTVWSDKSVLTDPSILGNNIELTEPDNFSVVLSAIASDTFVTGYQHDPVDTVLVIDSSSQNEETELLCKSLNTAIRGIMNINKNNRVGVVAYSGSHEDTDIVDSTVLLPMGRYTHTADEFFVTDRVEKICAGTELIVDRISVNKGVVRGDSLPAESRSVLVHGGSYIQSGIYTAMKEFLSVKDTVIPQGAMQAGAERLPVMVLISSGAPNLATSDYTNVGTFNMGDGSETANELMSAIPFVTQLTVSYAKNRISDHYGRPAALYTLSLDMGDHPVVNPISSGTNINKHWNTYNSTLSDVTMQLGVGRTWIETDNGGYWQANYVGITKTDKELDKNYVNGYFRADISVEDAFKALVSEIDSKSMYYPTYVEGDNNELGGYIEFIDDIGKYMEVKCINGIKLGGVLFTGEALAKNFQPGGGGLGSIDDPTDLGNELIWSVMERLGISDIDTARDIITHAYVAGELKYDPLTGEYSNYIGWYADENGDFISHACNIDGDLPDNAVFYNKSYGFTGAVSEGHRETDMMHVSVQVHTRIATGTSAVIFRIPAALIPVIRYNVSITGDSLEDPGDIFLSRDNTMDVDTNGDGVYDDALSVEPIRLVYEVGLMNDIDEITVHDKVSSDYKYQKDGKYFFYTNRWNPDDLDHSHPSVAENTVSFFSPSVENERYYYTENSPVYILSGSEYQKYTGADKPQYESGKYYRSFDVFEYSSEAEGGNAIIHTHYEEIAEKSLQKAEYSEQGYWYIPRGTIHRYYTDYSNPKSENKTGTLEYSHYPSVEAIDGKAGRNDYYVDFVLGNNGVYTIEAATGIKISTVKDDTMLEHHDSYSFEITGKDGSYRQVRYDDNGNRISKPLIISGGSAIVNIDDGTSLYIVDLPASESFNIRELTEGTPYEVGSINGRDEDNVNITIADHMLETVEFVNTLKAPEDSASVVLRPIVHHPFDGPYKGGSNFVFSIRCYDSSDKLIYEKSVALDDMETERIDNIPVGSKVVIEQTGVPSGFITDKENNKVSFIVDSEKVYAQSFINTYSPMALSNPDITVTGEKALEGRTDDMWLESDVFTFLLQKKVGSMWVDMGTDTVNKQDKTFDFTSLIKSEIYDRAGAYSYRITEVYSENPYQGIIYDRNTCWFDVVVADSNWDGKYEVDSVIGYNGIMVGMKGKTYTAHASFVNTYSVAGTDVVTILVNATVDDRTGAAVPKAPSGLTFGLYQSGVLVQTLPVTSAAGESMISLNFGSLNVGKNIEYTLKQIIPDEPVRSMEYSDREYPITVKVYDDTMGGVYARISSEGRSGQQLTFDFENVYEPSELMWIPCGSVKLEGGEIADGRFEFIISQADETFTEFTELERVKNEGDKVTFSPINVNKVGKYFYVVTQVDLGEDGMTYDTLSFEMMLDVVDMGGYYTGWLEKAPEFEFVNSYKQPAVPDIKPGESQNNTAKPGQTKPSTSPQTEDKADFVLWYSMLAISAFGFAILAFTSKKITGRSRRR